MRLSQSILLQLRLLCRYYTIIYIYTRVRVSIAESQLGDRYRVRTNADTIVTDIAVTRSVYNARYQLYIISNVKTVRRRARIRCRNRQLLEMNEKK